MDANLFPPMIPRFPYRQTVEKPAGLQLAVRTIGFDPVHFH